jgi:hypothetical protein
MESSNPDTGALGQSGTAAELGGTEQPTESFRDLQARRHAYFEQSKDSPADKIGSLMRFMSRQDLAKLSCYMDVFNATEGVAGSIMECGVYFGNGLMTWAKLSAAMEPYNYNCRVVGFDTFTGNIGESDLDKSDQEGINKGAGGYFANSVQDLEECIAIFDSDRPLNHYPKVELIEGDLRTSAVEYVEKNSHALVRILSLSVNLYEPSLAALKAFLPRMPKGSAIVAFTLNTPIYPGATLALLEEVGVRDASIVTPAKYPNFNYVIL